MYRPQFKVDPQKCKHTGLCAASCPLRLITISEKDKLPHWVAGAEKQCLKCERCVASCPNQAISLNIIKNEEERRTNNLFTVDLQKCRREGICAAVCPLQLITFNKKDKLPTPIEKAEELCIHCGHCVTICPSGAISLKTLKPGKLSVATDGTLFYGPISLQTMKPEECAPVNTHLLPSPEQVRHLLTARRSIRAYKTQPVDRKTLSGIINTASFAPTAGNLQPVNWLVIEETVEISFLADLVIDWMRQVIKEEPEMAESMHMKLLV
ncbi:MAG: 4Fe-4S dicluster domain-containing protein, partial [Desulfotomaculaceae bacterium]|nr:4Fe-4S dicluster domain-containing protein [Desulfotomaculaceae bacterium]